MEIVSIYGLLLNRTTLKEVRILLGFLKSHHFLRQWMDGMDAANN